MDSTLIFTAFVFGFTVSRVGLPPLVGYLIAGFTLHYFGLQSSESIQYLADMGILLLLFSIGLKLKVKTLLRPEIWGSATSHMGITVCIFSSFILITSFISHSIFPDFSMNQALLLAFALSFSSTVFAVKTFEERGDIDSLHGRIAIGVLIIQDIAAVIYLTFSKGVLPSPWSPLIIPALFILRPILLVLLSRSGHRELLLLFGLFVPIGLGAGSFEFFNLKPDLGALIFGVLLANSPKAGELSEAILSLKDLFLVGFFLQIGLSGLPTLHSLLIALCLLVLIAIKSGLFFLLFVRFKLRARTALLSALALANYSEFGLLVCSIGVKEGILTSDWLVIMALALSFSFMIAAPFNSRAHAIYTQFSERLRNFESKNRLPYDQPIDTGNANVLIFGMGRIGTRVYDTLQDKEGLLLIGLDYNEEGVQEHQKAGRNVIHADATDSDLWEKISTRSVDLVMLTMASHQTNMYTIERLRESGFKGKISATSRFPDELKELENAEVAFAYDLYQEAGQGFADDICRQLVKDGKLIL